MFRVFVSLIEPAACRFSWSRRCLRGWSSLLVALLRKTVLDMRRLRVKTENLMENARRKWCHDLSRSAGTHREALGKKLKQGFKTSIMGEKAAIYLTYAITYLQEAVQRSTWWPWKRTELQFQQPLCPHQRYPHREQPEKQQNSRQTRQTQPCTRQDLHKFSSGYSECLPRQLPA